MMRFLVLGCIWLFGIVGILSAIGNLFGLAGSKAGESLFFLIVGLVFAVPLGLLLVRNRKHSKARLEFESMIAADGPADHSFFANGTGIAVSSGRRKMYLAQESRCKAYDYADVRNWTNQKAGVPLVVNPSPSALEAMSMVLGSVLQESKDTGLFLEVRDTQIPRWHVKMYDENDRARWVEILRQQAEKS